ncbi:MAG: hypothetical protein CVV23_06180 [Ignavibacteriae bacterium HGW-Ignavibacteriae-2]|jgi:UDP-N-acetylmuramoyl-tripeptide--D-alanyl-D-alanine ligase|nr:MAG: hypothetical protein CVV23_06180 [Ignavibacteriae bacterium HGW-Ignavibacteriae-2]
MKRASINISDLFDLPGAVIYNPDEFKSCGSVSIDSRTIKKNTLFVAIKGQNFDGHNFVEQAVKSGANAVVIDSRNLKKFKGINITIITVPDTIKAYGQIANIWRRKLGAKIISITGSNGKTTTKDILAELLQSKYKVVKTISNNNNHIGVPLTILSAKSGTEVIVLEHGTNHFGEIEYTSEIAKPDIAIITNIGESHLEFLIDKSGVYNEKAKLFDACIANNGTVVINSDDPIIKKNLKKNTKKISYGSNGNPDYKGKILRYNDYGQLVLEITSGEKSNEFVLPLYGKSNAQNFLAAYTIADMMGVSKTAIQKVTKKITSPKGRLNLFVFNNSLLVDDTYNSNPVSVKAAIDVIKNIKVYNHSLLILGDMFELGERAIEFHKHLAEDVKNIKRVRVATIGKLMKNLADELQKNSIDSVHFNTKKQLEKFLLATDLTNYKILVKGSRGMKMEQFVELIKTKAA